MRFTGCAYNQTLCQDTNVAMLYIKLDNKKNVMVSKSRGTNKLRKRYLRTCDWYVYKFLIKAIIYGYDDIKSQRIVTLYSLYKFCPAKQILQTETCH